MKRPIEELYRELEEAVDNRNDCRRLLAVYLETLRNIASGRTLILKAELEARK